MTLLGSNGIKKLYFSPLRYPGGKTALFPFFARIIKENNLEKITYIEPFAGGAGAALALLFLEKVERIVINDLDKAIYSFWNSSIFESERFIEKIKLTPISVNEWRRQKQIYNDPSSSQFDLGFATFFLNRTNRSGILDGGPIGGLNQTGPWKINARFNKEKLIEKIAQLQMYRNRISVSNEDGIHLINEFIGKKNAFIYLDPPYYEKGSTLYLNHYKKEDHEELAKCLNTYPEALWILTYDNKDEISNLYSSRNKINFSLHYNAYESREGKELLIISDALSI